MSVSVPVASAAALAVDVVPLGGLGEFGLNMMAISCGFTPDASRSCRNVTTAACSSA